MRDIYMLLVLPFLVFVIVQRPFIGLGLWIWTAMFFPNGWVYGIAGTIRYNLLFTILTMLVYLAQKQKTPLRLGFTGGLILLFLFWTFITTIFGIGNPDLAWDFWFRLVKIMLLFIFISTYC